MTEQFENVEAWRLALGLSHVSLRETDERRFVLLNGSIGNFCLDFAGGLGRSERCVSAWSSDVGHYLTINDDRLILNRWDRRDSEETYAIKSVLSRIHDFHRFLENNSPGRSKSIVAHALQVFRLIRSMVNDDQNGANSLRIFIALLAKAASNDEQGSNNPEISDLTQKTTEASRELSPAAWNSLYRDLCGMGRFDVPRPDVALVLRHASGAVFQEAHRAASLASTLWLPGLEGPSSIIRKGRPEEVGVFFTPPALARTLAEEGILALEIPRQASVRIFDPACGSGELLKECLRNLKQRGHLGKIEIVGWDESALSIDMAQFVLGWERQSWKPGQIEITLTRMNSLEAPAWPSGVDLVIMNPPFLSSELMSEKQKTIVAEVLGGKHRNRPNLAMVFALRSLESIQENGVLAMVAPNSLLEAASARMIREALAASLKPRMLARLGSQYIFTDALVDVGLYVGKRTIASQTEAAVVWADSQTGSVSQALRGLRKWRGSEPEPILGEGFSVYRRSDIATSSAPWAARDYRAWQFYNAFSLTRKAISAKKLFDIRQGVRMGSDLFIVSDDYFCQLSKSEQRFFRPAVMNPSFNDGVLTEKHFIFYPTTVGLPKIENERDLKTQVPTYYRDFLGPNESRLRARRSLHDKASWWSLSERRAWLEEKKPRLISKYFGADRAFAFDPRGDSVVVVGHGWVLKRDLLGESNLTDVEVYLGMLAFLNSSVFKFLALFTSVQIAGGQFDLSNRYVENIPLPNPEKLKEGFPQLIEAGKRILDRDKTIWSVLDEIVTRSLLS